jgi:zinc transport system ATP-binding protein
VTVSADERPLLELEQLRVRRGAEVVLDGVSLRVAPATIHALVGPNGAGKSTLLAAVLGQLPFEGRARLHARRDGRIGYVPQRFEGEDHLPLTVAEFLALSRQGWPLCWGIRPAVRPRVAAALDRLGLAGFERRLVGELSGGELRRVLLANATEPAPELLLLDEPAAGLDLASQQRLEEALVGLRRDGTAVVLVVHDLDQARRLADRVTVLDRRVVREGPPAEVLPLATTQLPGTVA